MATATTFYRDEYPDQVEHGVTEEVTGVDLVETFLLPVAGDSTTGKGHQNFDALYRVPRLRWSLAHNLPWRNQPLLFSGWSRRAHRFALLQRLHHTASLR